MDKGTEHRIGGASRQSEYSAQRVGLGHVERRAGGHSPRVSVPQRVAWIAGNRLLPQEMEVLERVEGNPCE